MGQPARQHKQGRSLAQRTPAFLKHPLGAALLTFLFTGIGAALFSKFLDTVSKTRDLELAATQRAAESVKTIADLIFERTFRATMIVSSIQRKADLAEIKARKTQYDVVYVRYNSTIQSNLFRVREMFRTTEYTDFERLLEGPVRELLVAQDDCVTIAYDKATSQDESTRASATEILTHCPGRGRGEDIANIWSAIAGCEYAYTNALFRVVEQQVSPTVIQALKQEVSRACQFPNSTANTKS
jgi:hypothetical protein